MVSGQACFRHGVFPAAVQRQWVDVGQHTLFLIRHNGGRLRAAAGRHVEIRHLPYRPKASSMVIRPLEDPLNSVGDMRVALRFAHRPRLGH